MASQCVGFSLLLLSCLLALSTAAPFTPVTSPEDADEALSKTLNLVQPSRLEVRPFKVASDDRTPLSGDIEDRTPLVDDAPKSYVEASEFRTPLADAIKPKPSFYVKKSSKNTKDEPAMKKDVLVPSDKLEPPVDEKTFDDEVVTVSSAVVDDEGRKQDETTMTSSGTNEGAELPRLSPPIWLHSSLAEAMSDPLRLPMIEPYDRYDRYSHSIARDVLW